MVHRVFRFALLAALPVAAAAQSSGVTAEWDLRPMLASLSDQMKRLKTTLAQIQPKDWVAKGAPDAYVSQHQSTDAEIGYLVGTAEKLAAQPEKLSIALEAVFRLEAVEIFVGSLAAGVEKYQNPAVAQLLRAQLGESAVNRGKLRQYVIDLAATREVELRVLEQEAQRCRAFLSRQPSASPTPKKK